MYLSGAGSKTQDQQQGCYLNQMIAEMEVQEEKKQKDVAQPPLNVSFQQQDMVTTDNQSFGRSSVEELRKNMQPIKDKRGSYMFIRDNQKNEGQISTKANKTFQKTKSVE